MRQFLDVDKLDLAKLEDIHTCWRVRRFLQLDFVDESAGMNVAATTTALLLCSITIAGLLDWLVHDTGFTAGLAGTIILTTALTIAMLNILDACIAINQMLQRDARILTDARIDALLSTLACGCVFMGFNRKPSSLNPARVV